MIVFDHHAQLPGLHHTVHHGITQHGIDTGLSTVTGCLECVYQVGIQTPCDLSLGAIFKRLTRVAYPAQF